MLLPISSELRAWIAAPKFFATAFARRARSWPAASGVMTTNATTTFLHVGHAVEPLRPRGRDLKWAAQRAGENLNRYLKARVHPNDLGEARSWGLNHQGTVFGHLEARSIANTDIDGSTVRRSFVWVYDGRQRRKQRCVETG